MRGDFSRIRFNPGKSYTAVLEQQGRVALDADANEQSFIDDHYSRAAAIAVVGEFGGPAQDEGFYITVPNVQEILIGPGRYYVDGLLCENPALQSYDSQQYLIDPADNAGTLLTQLAQSGGSLVLQVWLEVWQQLVTALDDPCLREPALGQADTTARLQTVWRVVAELASPAGQQGAGTGMSPCCQAMYKAAAPQLSSGQMNAKLTVPSADCSCAPVAAAGYQGIENQLYRIEIQLSGDETSATFKWSRENASVVAAVTNMSVPDSTVWLDSLGPDANLGFQAGQWIEVTDDTYLFGAQPNHPGRLYQIKSVSPDDLSLILYPPVTLIDLSRRPRARRWDQSGPSATASGIPLPVAEPLQLENGIQVQFTAGTYQSGDYWTIPARTASGQIEWPPCGSDGNDFQSPGSIQVRRAPLACIHWSDGSGGVFTTDDCRKIFSPLTVLTPPLPAQAIHVNSISWVNDDVMTLEQLQANGLAITLDRAPSSPVTEANLIITAEPATLAKFGDPPVISVLSGDISVTGQTINWTLNNASLPPALQLQLFRVRVKLLGQMIFADGPDEPTYLDGLAFGRPATRKDGTTARIDLRLPTDTGAATSDFESWFDLREYLLTWQQVGNTTGFGQIVGDPIWTGNFSTTGQTQIMFYSPADGNWRLGTLTGGQLKWNLAGNTASQGFDPVSDLAFAGNFSNSGRAQIMLYDSDQNWYLGAVDTDGKLPDNWPYVGYSANDFLEADATWTGDFSGAGYTQIMLYDNSGGTGGSNYWWLVDGNGWTLVQGQPPGGEGSALAQGIPSWAGDFAGSGQTQIMFYDATVSNWWLGLVTGSAPNWQLNWSNVGNTSILGLLGGNFFWAGDFAGTGRTQLLSYSPSDSNWWLFTVTGSAPNWQLNWSNVGNTSILGPYAGNLFWAGDFASTGRTQLLSYSPSDQNWWLFTVTGSAPNWQLNWQPTGNTSLLGQIGSDLFWTGDFANTGQTQQLLFYSPSDQNWWLGTSGPAQ
jgi:hypothetical protein